MQLKINKSIQIHHCLSHFSWVAHVMQALRRGKNTNVATHRYNKLLHQIELPNYRLWKHKNIVQHFSFFADGSVASNRARPCQKLTSNTTMKDIGTKTLLGIYIRFLWLVKFTKSKNRTADAAYLVPEHPQYVDKRGSVVVPLQRQ